MLKTILQSLAQTLKKAFDISKIVFSSVADAGKKALNYVNKIPLPVQLLIVIGFVFLFGIYIPDSIARIFFTFSLTFRVFLLLFLPFMLFAFVFNGVLSFKKSATIVLLILIGAIFVSNMFISLMTYATARIVLPSIVQEMVIAQLKTGMGLEPIIPIVIIESLLTFVRFFKLDYVLFAAIILGIFFSVISVPKVENFMGKFKDIVENVLRFGFIPFLPLYIFGFLLEMQRKGIFSEIFKHFGKAFLLILSIQILYLFLFYLAAAGFSLKRGWKAIKIALPSYIAAFSTMSSMVALPISIDSAAKNTRNKPLAEMSMPIMANLHFWGLATNMPILALVTMVIFWGIIPDFVTYFKFVLHMCYTMIAISGVPGSGIFLMIPILISQFGFTPAMIEVVSLLYLLIESFGTAANVFGDGALVIIINKIIKRLKIS